MRKTKKEPQDEKPAENPPGPPPEAPVEDPPPEVTAENVIPLEPRPPRPRRARRTKAEIAAEEAAASEARRAERMANARAATALVVSVLDNVLGSALPPPLDAREKMVLEHACARYLETQDLAEYLTPGWMLLAALTMIVVPRAIARFSAPPTVPLHADPVEPADQPPPPDAPPIG